MGTVLNKFHRVFPNMDTLQCTSSILICTHSPTVETFALTTTTAAKVMIYDAFCARSGCLQDERNLVGYAFLKEITYLEYW